MKGAQNTIVDATGYIMEFLFDRETIYENVMKILHNYNFKESPLVL